MKCPTCNREWDENTEQAVCISMFGSCIVCRYRDHAPIGMTSDQADDEFSLISAEYNKQPTARIITKEMEG
jgi:hypothetical protein